MPVKPSDGPESPTPTATTTLHESEIITERLVGRRSVLTAIQATLLGAVAIASAGWVTPSGTTKDAPVGGPPGAAGGVTDSDSGPSADPAGRGRGTGGGARPGATGGGITDADAGPGADPAGGGHGTRGGGVTDVDYGPSADPTGRGRGGGPRNYPNGPAARYPAPGPVAPPRAVPVRPR